MSFQVSAFRPQLFRRRRAFALVAVIIVVAVLTIMSVAFMQSMRIDRLTARAYLNKTRAEMAAEAGVEEMIKKLEAGATRGSYATYFEHLNGQKNPAQPLLMYYPDGASIPTVVKLTSEPDPIDPSTTSLPFELNGQAITVDVQKLRDDNNQAIGGYAYWILDNSNLQPLRHYRGEDRGYLTSMNELSLTDSAGEAIETNEPQLYEIIEENIDTLPSVETLNQVIGTRPIDTALHTDFNASLLLTPEGYPRLNLRQLKDYIDGSQVEYEGFDQSMGGGYPGLSTVQGPASPRVRLIDELLDAADSDADETNNNGYLVKKAWGYGSLKWLSQRYPLDQARQIVANLIDYMDSDFIPTCDADAGSAPSSNNSPPYTSHGHVIVSTPAATVMGVEARVTTVGFDNIIQGHPFFNYLGSGIIINAGSTHANSTRILAYTVLCNPYEGNGQRWSTFYRLELQLEAIGGPATWSVSSNTPAYLQSGQGNPNQIFMQGWLSQEANPSSDFAGQWLSPFSALLLPRGDGDGNDFANGYYNTYVNNLNIARLGFRLNVARLVYINNTSRYLVQDISALRTRTKVYRNSSGGPTLNKNNGTTLIEKLGSGPVQNDFWLQGDPRLNFKADQWTLAGAQAVGGSSSGSHPNPHTVAIDAGMSAPGADGDQGARNSHEWWKNTGTPSSPTGVSRHFPTYDSGYRPSPPTDEWPMRSPAELGFIHRGESWATLRIHGAGQTSGSEDWRLLDYVHFGRHLKQVEYDGTHPVTGEPMLKRVNLPYPDVPWLQVAEGRFNANSLHRIHWANFLKNGPDLNGDTIDNATAVAIADSIATVDSTAGNALLGAPFFVGNLTAAPSLINRSSFDFEKEQYLSGMLNGLTQHSLGFTVYVAGFSYDGTGRISGKSLKKLQVHLNLETDPSGTFKLKPITISRKNL